MVLRYDLVATKLILMFFKLLGLAPFTVKLTGHNLVPLKFMPSRFGCLYNFFLIAVQFRILFIAIPNAFSDVYETKSDTTVVISLTASVFVNLALFVLYLIFGLRQKTAVRLLNNLFSVNSTDVGKNGIGKCRSSRNFFILVFLTIVIVTTGFQMSRVLGFHFRVASHFRVDIPTIIVAWFITTYIFVIKLIVNRLRAVNCVLLDHFENSSMAHSHRLIVAQHVSLNTQIRPKIITLRKFHANLYEIATEVSEFYAVPILLAIAPLCFIATYCTYFLIVPIISMVDVQSYFVISASVLFLTTSILPIIILAFVLTGAMTEMQRTADIVNKLIICANIDGEDGAELKQFAFELMNRKIRFTACGFFSLDCSLLHSILSVITTYLIILIQHQLGLDAKTAQNKIHNCTRVELNSSES